MSAGRLILVGKILHTIVKFASSSHRARGNVKSFIHSLRPVDERAREDNAWDKIIVMLFASCLLRLWTYTYIPAYLSFSLFCTAHTVQLLHFVVLTISAGTLYTWYFLVRELFVGTVPYLLRSIFTTRSTLQVGILLGVRYTYVTVRFCKKILLHRYYRYILCSSTRLPSS